MVNQIIIEMVKKPRKLMTRFVKIVEILAKNYFKNFIKTIEKS